jgi:hypothetical protein
VVALKGRWLRMLRVLLLCRGCFRMTKQRQPFDASGFVAVAGEKEEETKFRSFGSQERSWLKEELRLRNVDCVE